MGVWLRVKHPTTLVVQFTDCTGLSVVQEACAQLLKQYVGFPTSVHLSFLFFFYVNYMLTF